MTTSPLSQSSSRSWIAWLNVFGTFAALLLIYSFFAAQAESFRTYGTIETIARQTTIVSIAAMGMTLIIMSGGIDLSVGSQIALTTVTVALSLKHGAGPFTATLVGIATGAACGLANGILITGLKVVPFIVTLGTLLIFRGTANALAGEQTVNTSAKGLQLVMRRLPPDQQWMLFPPGVWLMIILVGLTALVLRYTRFGRHVVAIGSNEQTARLCGVRVNRTKILVYLLSGALCGVAGVMQFSRLTVGDPTVANGLELAVVAAVVIGGASLNGGEGSPLGSLIGAAIMTTISAGGSHLRWPNPTQAIITGVIIVLAVALDRLRQRKASAATDG